MIKCKNSMAVSDCDDEILHDWENDPRLKIYILQVGGIPKKMKILKEIVHSTYDDFFSFFRYGECFAFMVVAVASNKHAAVYILDGYYIIKYFGIKYLKLILVPLNTHLQCI